jgi:hypothetical protein
LGLSKKADTQLLHLEGLNWQVKHKTEQEEQAIKLKFGKKPEGQFKAHDPLYG